MEEKQPNILIVDDEALFRTSAVDALELAFPGYCILEAANGQEALGQIAKHSIDVVVTDISMPVMGGLELMLSLREQRFQGPVIVVTAFGDPRLESQVSLHGAFGYLEKPVELQELVEVIEAAAEGAHSHIEGLTLAGFVQLLALERKTCRLRVSKNHRHGDLLFQDGVLVDAKLGRLIGDQAALTLLSWDEGARLDLHTTIHPRRTTVTENLNHLLLEAMRLRDEEGRAISQDDIPDPTFSDATGRETTSPPEKDLESSFSAPPAESTSRATKKTSIQGALREAMTIDGALGVALVDMSTGTLVHRAGGSKEINLELAAIENIAVLRSKRKVMEDLALEDSIEDILISLGHHYHLIRPIEPTDRYFLYLALRRERANLAMARHRLISIEQKMEFKAIIGRSRNRGSAAPDR